MVMLGTEAERVFGRANWKDLYSVISGGGEYRAITPEGDMVGKLDARFVNSKNSEEISLGGRSWSMVKCDEGHNIVVVVPSGSDSSRIFWTSSGDSGVSPLVCRKVQQICSQGKSALPLGDHELEVIQTMLDKIPDGLGKKGLYVVDQKSVKGMEVPILSFSGSRFNRLLSLLLKDRLGAKARVKFSDFTIRVTRAAKEGTEDRILGALKEIQKMEMDEIQAALPIPQAGTWKFACALPVSLLSDLSLSDHYHVEEFMHSIRNLPIVILHNHDSQKR
jgi:ATP-dependent Lhr-like helicase